ncbi:DUF2271 domain-containing protein [Spirosoma sp.]|uniref:DUF2271 domain-containing protein n=1 Tax=Spirosoma sp. TaxID=1899569 RepID=UPI00261FE302|nr:DUF2271 domain-containing protein [Spirosoma sp.]MCX6215833.1 DUF2271 domain-containing protein [Spirosoma sp.]
MTLVKIGMAGLSLMAPVLTTTAPSPSAGMYISQLENVLGTSLVIKAIAPTLAAARQAEQAALTEIERLSQILSSYRPESEFSRWAATDNVTTHVSADLFAVLAQFDAWFDRTAGAINAGAESISQVWQRVATTGTLPAEADLAHAVNNAQQRHWRLNPTQQTATRLSLAPLRLHTFAKSYVLERAAEAALSVADVQGVVLNGGGDLVVRGNWVEPVGVANPHADAENHALLSRFAVQNGAVATSGNYRRGIQLGDDWFSHIVDPRTGQPANAIASATVVHPDAVTAGALATTFSILTPAESEALAATLPGTEFFIVTSNGQQHRSPGWEATAIPVSSDLTTARLMHLAPTKDKLWNPDQEVLISLELPQFPGRSHRPFVAIWIEDEKGNPVRNLALWYNKPRWLPELRDWYAQRRNPDFEAASASVTSATRSPGAYTLSWDGKDNAGQFVKQGNYTVFIEAAREHGTYQLIKQQMDFNGKPKQLSLPGNVEITTAALDYRKKSDAR